MYGGYCIDRDNARLIVRDLAMNYFYSHSTMRSCAAAPISECPLRIFGSFEIRWKMILYRLAPISSCRYCPRNPLG
jgi:hypothetical protein